MHILCGFVYIEYAWDGISTNIWLSSRVGDKIRCGWVASTEDHVDSTDEF